MRLRVTLAYIHGVLLMGKELEVNLVAGRGDIRVGSETREFKVGRNR